MPLIMLHAQSTTSEPLSAIFDPDHGMRLKSFQWGNRKLVSEDSGPVGPHFGDLHPGINVQKYHDGIAWHAPWKATANETQVKAQLTGKDEWNGKTIAALEGQAFKMEMAATLSADGLAIDISVVADADAVAGYGCHFPIEKGQAHVISDVQGQLLHKGHLQNISSEWDYSPQGKLNLPVHNAVDVVFHPGGNGLQSLIQLDTGHGQVKIKTMCQNAENSWQLKYHPDHSTVYLAALAAKSPFRPILTVNSIRLEISI